MRLPKSLLAFAVSFFIATLPVAGILPANTGGWVMVGILGLGVLWGVSELFFGMTWGGPMKHAFAGALHLAWHRRAERFGGGRSTGLKPLDLEDPNAPLGVEKPVDFTWNQLLGFDACVQCGKCETMCPAFAAGQPLNPKSSSRTWSSAWPVVLTRSLPAAHTRANRSVSMAATRTSRSSMAWSTPKRCGRVPPAVPALRNAR